MLNGALIRERRLELGLTRPALARELALSTAVVDGLERESNHPEQTLATLAKLASALGLEPAQLLTREDAAPPPAADDTRLEAAFAAVRQGISAEDLARALDWPLARTHAAIDTLRRRLTHSGQRLHRSAGNYRLDYNRDTLSDADLQGLERRRVVASNGLRQQEAQMLLAVMRGDVTERWLSRKHGNTHPNAHRLVRLGYAEHHSGGLRLTSAVERSLGLRR